MRDHHQRVEGVDLDQVPGSLHLGAFRTFL